MKEENANYVDYDLILEEQGKIVWGTDILDSQIYYEGQLKGGHGLAIGARRSYIDLFIPLFTPSDFTIKPRYWDYSAKWVPTLPGGQKFSAFVYGFDDILEILSRRDC